MAKKKDLSIDVLRTKAWFAEVLVASGTTSAYQLKKLASDERARAIKFDYYRTGERAPAEETLALIEETFGSAPSAVFRQGPESAPLWDVLAGNAAACQQAVIRWLAGTNHRIATDQVARAFATLEKQVESGFRTLGIDLPDWLRKSPGFCYTYEVTAPPEGGQDGARWYRPKETGSVVFGSGTGRLKSRVVAGSEPADSPLDSVEGLPDRNKAGWQIRSSSTPVFLAENRPAFLGEDERKAPGKGARAAFVTLAAASPVVSSIRNPEGPFPLPAVAVQPEAVCGVFALRTLAVMRGELLRETAYLLEVVRPLLPAVFKEWNIGADLAAFVSGTADGDEDTASGRRAVRAPRRSRRS